MVKSCHVDSAIRSSAQPDMRSLLLLLFFFSDQAFVCISVYFGCRLENISSKPV